MTAEPTLSRSTKWRFAELPPADIAEGIHEVAAHFPRRMAGSAGGISLAFRRDAAIPRGWRAEWCDDRILVAYDRPADAFRAIGMLMGQTLKGQPPAIREEQCALESMGVMIDASRNGVPTVPTVCKLIRSFALMGVTWLMLYTEDTYSVPGEPMFGYFRGRYSRQELEQIDRYAALFGMEVIPCIQTLGHLGQILRWPAYSQLRDTSDVLLAESDATYELVSKMIEAASAPFRSRRIHIGMDEAHGIGNGRYRLRNGVRRPFDILARHLDHVASCCERLQLRPMIWSDMYFRLGSKSNDYYDQASTIPQETGAAIPESVQLVYWDYYHLEADFYSEWIRRHRALGKEPIFAAGIWSWSRFWTALPHSFATLEAGMRSARREKLTEAFVTMWGDDGMECDLYSILPAVGRFADLAYGRESRDELCFSLYGSSDIDLDDWMMGSRLDCPPGVGNPECTSGNFSKWLLWLDPILNFLGNHIPPGAGKHYESLGQQLRAAAGKGNLSSRLGFPALVAEALAAKISLRQKVTEAYANRDLALVEDLLHRLLPDFRTKAEALWNAHRVLWHELYKPFGWEVLDRRYGALLARCETLGLLLEEMQKNPHCRLEELEAESETIFDPPILKDICLTYPACSSPSVIF